MFIVTMSWLAKPRRCPYLCPHPHNCPYLRPRPRRCPCLHPHPRHCPCLHPHPHYCPCLHPLAHGRALHDFDVLALELEKLHGHFHDHLPRFASFGAAADWHLELAWWGNYVSARPTKKELVGSS